MNKVSLSIGMTFTAPEPGSFWAPFVTHNDFAQKAKEVRGEERRERAGRERRFRLDLWRAGKAIAKEHGASPDDLFWPLLAAVGVIMRMTRMTAALPMYHKAARSCVSSGGIDVRFVHYNEAEGGIRRPSPVETRTAVQPGTGGIDRRRAEKSRVFAGDRVTPPRRRSAIETFVSRKTPTIVIRQRVPFQPRTAELEGGSEPRELTAIRVEPVLHLPSQNAAPSSPWATVR